MGDGGVNGLLDVGLVGDVAVDVRGNGRAEGAAECVAFVVLDVSDHDPGAVAGEELGGGLADAASCAGDQGHLAF